MQVVKFISATKNAAGYYPCWCTTNTLTMFRDFMQYLLDISIDKGDFYIVDTSSDKVYDAYRIATEVYKMRPRTFSERMKNIQTGSWTKYSDNQLNELSKMGGAIA